MCLGDKQTRTMGQKNRRSPFQFLKVIRSLQASSCYGKCFLVKGVEEHNVWFVQSVWGGFPFSSFGVLGKSLRYSAFISLRCFFIEMFALKVEVEDKCWKTRPCVLDFEWFLHSWYQ